MEKGGSHSKTKQTWLAWFRWFVLCFSWNWRCKLHWYVLVWFFMNAKVFVNWYGNDISCEFHSLWCTIIFNVFLFSCSSILSATHGSSRSSQQSSISNKRSKKTKAVFYLKLFFSSLSVLIDSATPGSRLSPGPFNFCVDKSVHTNFEQDTVDASKTQPQVEATSLTTITKTSCW